jgi:TorA maturation chaperone TorD
LERALAELPGFDPGNRALRVDPSRLALEYRQVFSHNLTPDCPPYETQYGATHIFWQSQQLADIAGFYRAFGVEVSGTAHERADHLAVELEFMGYLCAKEAHALEHAQATQAEICRDAQAKFLKDHVGRWVKAFGVRVKAKLPQSASAQLVDVLGRIVEWDCQRLGVKPERLHFSANGPAPAEEGCFPCGGPGGPTCA